MIRFLLSIRSGFFILPMIWCASCKQNNIVNSQRSSSKIDTISQSHVESSTRATMPADTVVKFLWRQYQYDPKLKDSFYTTAINQPFCKTISDQERAALGYVATFIGNECTWDGTAKDDRSNLKCKILTALSLGYQCSEQHLGFLRKWFKNDSAVLKELTMQNCPTMPDGATIQNTFNEITLTVKGNMISVSFKAEGMNMREDRSWNWEETNYFLFNENGLQLIKKKTD